MTSASPQPSLPIARAESLAVERVTHEPLRRASLCPQAGVRRCPATLGGIGTTLALFLGGSLPATALEEIEVHFPLVDTPMVVKLEELRTAASLSAGDSDLAELDRSSDGAVGRRILPLFHQPLQLPAGVSGGLEASVGTPMLREALRFTTALIQVDGAGTDLSGSALSQALQQSERQGPVTLHSLLAAMPGRRATIQLDRALYIVERFRRHQQPARELLAARPPVRTDPGLTARGSHGVRRLERRLSVSHRSSPLRSVVLLPRGVKPKGLVLISHGLWDAPVNFEGWGQHLASHGYAVALPEHPGSDQAQQSAMLAGATPPPAPEELALRPLDVRAVIDALAADRFAVGPVPSAQVVVLGHSWGAITALQLAGLPPSDTRIQERCSNVDDPEINISWVLQCSFLQAANDAAMGDRRVLGVVAVSPPLRLLFGPGSSGQMHGRALVVSGSKDWVVPFGPEAFTPFQRQPEDRGHQLVLAKGGTHFNLRPGSAEPTVLRGLMLSWVQQVFAAGEGARPSAGAAPLLPASGWGEERFPLIEATPSLDPETEQGSPM